METINKRIGSRAIRKAHVTDMYKDAPSIAQKQALADIMNHKPETAEQFYCKKHFTGIQECRILNFRSFVWPCCR